jgi:hypothetical protein
MSVGIFLEKVMLGNRIILKKGMRKQAQLNDYYQVPNSLISFTDWQFTIVEISLSLLLSLWLTLPAIYDKRATDFFDRGKRILI